MRVIREIRTFEIQPIFTRYLLRIWLSFHAIPKSREKYGIFIIRFQEVWNDVSDDTKLLPLKRFKKNLKLIFFQKIWVILQALLCFFDPATLNPLYFFFVLPLNVFVYVRVCDVFVWNFIR